MTPTPFDVSTVLIHVKTDQYRWFVGVNAFIRAKNEYYSARLSGETTYPWRMYMRTTHGLAEITRPELGPESYR